MLVILCIFFVIIVSVFCIDKGSLLKCVIIGGLFINVFLFILILIILFVIFKLFWFKLNGL